MSIPEFPKYAPSKHELREFSRRMEGGENKLVDLARWLKELRKMSEDEAKNYLPPPDLLQRFYEETAEAYEQLPLSKEEIEEQFSAENLSRLTLQEYVDLLRRVPPRFVTHTTRQGIRDHISHHSGDQEKFNRGFEGMVEKGKIQSVLERFLEGIISKETVHSVLEQHLQIPEDFPTIDEARARIDEFLNRSSATNLAASEISDQRALHVAMDFVGDAFYGGESGNEIFFVYPTAYIASQHHVAPQYMPFPERLKLDEVGGTSQFNDFWIKSKNEGKGELPIDAAIVFLPESTPVDRNTGSRYMTTPEGKPVHNTEQIGNLKKFIESDELRELWPKIYRQVNEYRDQLGYLQQAEEKLAELRGNQKDDRGYDELVTKVDRLKDELDRQKEALRPLIDLARKYNISDQRFYIIFEKGDHTAWQSLRSLLNRSVNDIPFKNDNDDQIRVEGDIRELGLQYRLAVDTAPAQEYWEAYFTRTGHKPSKVIYYEQATPNNALRVFREKAGLMEDGPHRETNLREMFRENLVSNKEMHRRMEHERQLFLQFSEELLDEIYAKEK